MVNTQVLNARADMGTDEDYARCLAEYDNWVLLGRPD